jgi:hypothetical protein
MPREPSRTHAHAGALGTNCQATLTKSRERASLRKGAVGQNAVGHVGQDAVGAGRSRGESLGDDRLRPAAGASFRLRSPTHLAVTWKGMDGPRTRSRVLRRKAWRGERVARRGCVPLSRVLAGGEIERAVCGRSRPTPACGLADLSCAQLAGRAGVARSALGRTSGFVLLPLAVRRPEVVCARLPRERRAGGSSGGPHGWRVTPAAPAGNVG